MGILKGSCCIVGRRWNVLEVYTAEEAGFCFGVKRAIECAINAAKKEDDIPVYTLGPIIHNPQVVEQLEDLNIKVINSLEKINKGTLIIRSHGVSPEILQKAKKKGLNVIDATCPYVKNAQDNARNLVQEGFQTIIYGDHNHPEVIGILGATDKKALIISCQEELDAISLKKKLGFVAQTTKSPSSYRDLICSVIKKIKELKIYNTICSTTEKRQRAAINLAKKVEIMFVIGGYNSANTKRLAKVCAENCTPTYHIETVQDINWQCLQGKNKIGITAGASTPDWLIKEVIEAMSEEKKDLQQEINEEEVVEKNLEENSEAVETVEEETSVEETVETVENSEADSVEEETVEEEIAEAVENSEVDSVEEEIVEETEVEEETAETVDEETAEEEEEEEIVEDEQEEFNYSDNDIADLKKGQTVTGTVVEMKDNGIYVDVNYKTDGFIPLRELSHNEINSPEDIVNINDQIEVVILTLEDDEGNMILSKKRADYEKAWEKIMEAYDNNEEIEAEVTREVKGGLVVDLGLRGFIPASHVAIGFVEDLSQYVGQTLRLKVIEVERDNNNVVLSAKALLEEERAEEKDETLANLEEGQIVSGVITKLVNFGAFVDLGGVEGLLHISEMSWGRIGHPSDLFEEGQDIEVSILSINKEKERISLGYKQLLADPWEDFAEKHYEGEIVTGTITKTVDFGAFMELEKGIEGLIHISQLSHRHVKNAEEVVSVGEEIQAKIINIDKEQKRVGLSIKELEEKPVAKKETKAKVKNNNSNNKQNDESEDSGVTIGDLVGNLFEEDK